MGKIRVMVNGLPGKMATKVAEHVIQSPDFEIVPISFSGSSCRKSMIKVGGQYVSLVWPETREDINRDEISQAPPLHVDYTKPQAVNPNADYYCRNMLPFVMGTTGGDRKALEERVKDSDVVAVIAPNMAKQIVAFQAMMQYAAETFPNLFSGYTLEIRESHQQGKADTSGTARAMVGYFNRLGIPFKEDQIVMVRDPERQLELGVPEEHLKGHGWHTYTLRSNDGTVLFEFTHNVNGRDIYAHGTLDALRFLQKKVDAGEKGRAYSMIDVLKGA